jgi:hypothetical protein
MVVINIFVFADINLDGDDNKPEVADWDILSPPLERQSSENAAAGLQGLEKKKKARIRVGMGEFDKPVVWWLI